MCPPSLEGHLLSRFWGNNFSSTNPGTRDDWIKLKPPRYVRTTWSADPTTPPALFPTASPTHPQYLQTYHIVGLSIWGTLGQELAGDIWVVLSVPFLTQGESGKQGVRWVEQRRPQMFPVVCQRFVGLHFAELLSLHSSPGKQNTENGHSCPFPMSQPLELSCSLNVVKCVVMERALDLYAQVLDLSFGSIMY